MRRFRFEAEIRASPARVWRALCEPGEVLIWDGGLERTLTIPPDYPRPGQHARWRLRSGLWSTLHDRPIEVLPERKLRSLLSAGPFRYDETYSLAARDGGCLLTAELLAWTALPIVGPAIDRAYLGPSVKDALQAALSAIQRLAESSP